MNSENSKYIGYVRVLSHEQSERNISIPFQIDQINEYAKKNNITIDKIIKEEVLQWFEWVNYKRGFKQDKFNLHIFM